MTRTDLLNIIPSAIRRNFTTATEAKALEAAEGVLDELDLRAADARARGVDR